MSSVKCLHPTTIYNQKALHILERKGWFFADLRAEQYETSLNLCSIRSGKIYVENEKTFNYLRPYKDIVIHNPSAVGSIFVIDNSGECVPIFRLVKCGKCELCRESKSNEWSTRCALECEAYSRLPLMLTLTYDPQHLPKDGVSKDHLQRFLKRLRINLCRYYNDPSIRVRYVACSEYGSKRHRPHYHLLLWNLPDRCSDWCYYENRYRLTHDALGLISSSWGQGFIKAVFCDNAKAGMYVCKYMRKGSQVLPHMNPTFFLASRRGGAIGWNGFVFHKLDSILYNNPSSPTLSYNSRHTGQNTQVCTPYYFYNKVFPTFNSVFTLEERNTLRNYMDCVQYLRERPKSLTSRIIFTKYGRSINERWFNLPQSFISRLYLDHPCNWRPQPLDSYGQFRNTEYCFELFERFLPRVMSLVSDLKRCRIADRNQRKRDLFISTRPVVDYNIQVEKEKTYLRSRKLFESSSDGQ